MTFLTTQMVILQGKEEQTLDSKELTVYHKTGTRLMLEGMQ